MVMLCRSEERANTAIKWITDNMLGDGNGSLLFEQCDLSLMESVRKCSGRLLNSLDKIDILINNAGILWDRGRTVTEDGFELTFATNHLGHFLLTDLVLPLLKKSAESGFTPRIVNVSSEAHRWRKGVLWDDLNMEKMDYDHGQAYTQSKVANILHAMELANRLKDSGILAFSVHPGLYFKHDRMLASNNVPFLQDSWKQRSLRSQVVEIWEWGALARFS